jgi:hypothetical protein
MHYNMDNLIREAIANRNVIEFSYHGYDRAAEPHVYGVSNGRKQILVYQIGGGTKSGGLPNWRRINVDEISATEIKHQTFSGQRLFPSSRELGNFDQIFSSVAPTKDELTD